MINRLMNPHTARDVKGFWFYFIPNPDLILAQQDLDDYPLLFTTTWTDTDVPPYAPEYTVEEITLDDGSTNEYALLNLTWYRRDWAITNMVDSDGNLIKCQYLPEDIGDWNVIIPYMIDADRNQIALSINYWNDPISSENPRFNKLEMTYLSATTIVVSTTVVDITGDYREHVRSEAIALSGQSGEQANTSIYHPQLNYRVVKEQSKPSTSYWTQSFGQINPIQLNGTTDVSEDEFASKIVTDSKFSYKSVPSGKGKLITSPWIGVGWYDQDAQTITTTATWNNIPNPPQEGRYEFYIYQSEILVYYYPDTYEVFISCSLGTDENGDFIWETPWKVGKEVVNEAGQCLVRCVVPSFFDIVPFILVNIELTQGSEWRVYHVLSVSSNLNEGKEADRPEGLTGEEFYTLMTTGNYFVIEDLTSLNSTSLSTDYLTVALYNETLGASPVDFNSLSYWSAQIQISFLTFLQGLRYFDDRNIQILDCGIVARKTGEEDIFLPYSILNESSRTSMVNLMYIPENSVIDNMLMYSGGKIQSLSSEDSFDVSQYDDIQMRHGIIVGSTGGTYSSIL